MEREAGSSKNHWLFFYVDDMKREVNRRLVIDLSLSRSSISSHFTVILLFLQKCNVVVSFCLAVIAIGQKCNNISCNPFLLTVREVHLFCLEEEDNIEVLLCCVYDHKIALFISLYCYRFNVNVMTWHLYL